MAKPIEINLLKLEDIQTLLRWTNEEGWIRTYDDQVAQFTAYPEGFFAARINGQFVGCISGVLLEKDIGIVGNFIVDKAFRGKGVGRALWKTVDEKLGLKEGKINSTLNAELFMIDTYRRYGFKVASWDLVFYAGKPNLEGLAINESICQSIVIQPIESSQIAEIIKYDNRVSSVKRDTFLASTLSITNSFPMYAMEADKVVGYGSIRPACKGHKIGPLYADNIHIARLLFKSLLKMVDEITDLCVKGVSPNNCMRIIAEELGLDQTKRPRKMYTLNELHIETDTVYGVLCTDVAIV